MTTTEPKQPEPLPAYGATMHLSNQMRRRPATAWLDALHITPTATSAITGRARLPFPSVQPAGTGCQPHRPRRRDRLLRSRPRTRRDRTRPWARRRKPGGDRSTSARPATATPRPAFITRYRHRHGYGPSWRDVGEHLALPKRQLRVLLIEPQHGHVVTFTAQSRSLDIWPHPQLESPPRQQCRTAGPTRNKQSTRIGPGQETADSNEQPSCPTTGVH